MNVKEWIESRSSSESEKARALLVAANFLDSEITGNDGESNNTPVAQFAEGEIILDGDGTRVDLNEQHN